MILLKYFENIIFGVSVKTIIPQTLTSALIQVLSRQYVLFNFFNQPLSKAI